MTHTTRHKVPAIWVAFLMSCSLVISAPVKASALGDVVTQICIEIILKTGEKVLQCTEEAVGLYHDLQVQQEAEEQAKQQQDALDKLKEEQGAEAQTQQKDEIDGFNTADLK